MLHRLAAAIVAASALAFSMAAQAEWPERPVKLIVPYAPGGASDFVARPWADALGKALKQPFVIDNRGGASGAIGAEAAIRSPADGYTLLVSPSAVLTQLPQLRKVSYDPQKDLMPVARLGDLVAGFTVLPALPIHTMKELVAYAKANPGKLAYGAPGPGTSNHLRLEMLKYRTGVDIAYVPYKGSGEALNDLLAGQIQIMNEINVIPHVKAGKLRLIAINYPTRHPDFPDVPTLTEAGYPDSDVPIFYALYAPAGTPSAIIATLNAAAVGIAKSPDMIARLQEINVAVPTQTPQEIAAAIAADIATSGKLIREANIRLE